MCSGCRRQVPARRFRSSTLTEGWSTSVSMRARAGAGQLGDAGADRAGQSLAPLLVDRRSPRGMLQQRGEFRSTAAEHHDQRVAGDLGGARDRGMQQGPAGNAHQLLRGAEARGGARGKDDREQSVAAADAAGHASGAPPAAREAHARRQQRHRPEHSAGAPRGCRRRRCRRSGASQATANPGPSSCSRASRRALQGPLRNAPNSCQRAGGGAAAASFSSACAAAAAAAQHRRSRRADPGSSRSPGRRPDSARDGRAPGTSPARNRGIPRRRAGTVKCAQPSRTGTCAAPRTPARPAPRCSRSRAELPQDELGFVHGVGRNLTIKASRRSPPRVPTGVAFGRSWGSRGGLAAGRAQCHCAGAPASVESHGFYTQVFEIPPRWLNPIRGSCTSSGDRALLTPTASARSRPSLSPPPPHAWPWCCPPARASPTACCAWWRWPSAQDVAYRGELAQLRSRHAAHRDRTADPRPVRRPTWQYLTATARTCWGSCTPSN